MGLCLGAQINKQDISKPQQETAGSRGLLTEHRVSLQGAEGPVPTGSQVTEPVCDPSWDAAGIHPPSCRPAGPRGASCVPSVPASSVKADVTHTAQGRAGGLRFQSSPQAGPELQGMGTASTLLQSSEMPGKCALETVARRETKKVALCSLSAATPALLGAGPQSQGGQTQQGGRWFEAYKKSAAG